MDDKEMREKFEEWLENTLGLSADWDNERNSYRQFPAHIGLLALKAGYQAAMSSIKIDDERIKKHVRNLEETSVNESSHELACRCVDSLEIIRGLQAALSDAQGDKEDAERYRWLRDDPRGRSLSVSAMEWSGDPSQADAAIDAARANQEKAK